MRSRKGSLELSMNAIVILILAITLLGLGLTFIRGMFEDIGSKASDAISMGELENPPNQDQPLTITPLKISVSLGKEATAQVGFLNTHGERVYCKLSQVSTHSLGIASPTVIYPDVILSGACTEIPNKGIIGRKLVIAAGDTATLGKMRIDIKAECWKQPATGTDYCEEGTPPSPSKKIAQVSRKDMIVDIIA